MLGPYPVDLVIEQLAAREELEIVGGAADLDVARSEPPRKTPAVYVLAEESARPGDYAEQGRQRVQVVVKAIIWVRHAGSADTGAKAVARMRTIETVVREQLLGFKPDQTAFEPLSLRASGADQYFGNHLIRQVLLDAAYTLTTEVP